MTKTRISRRNAIRMTATGLGLAGAAIAAPHAALAAAPRSEGLMAPGSRTLQHLMAALARSPRRRDFKTVPMILTHPDEWDAEALDRLLHYQGTPKQVWDNTAVESPWLNLMRNALNAQIWSFRHPDFLCVSATHGSAHMALYDDVIWDKYLRKFTQGKWTRNVWLKTSPAAHSNPADFENPRGAFSAHDNSIPVLQQRGVVFLACHNAVWELTMAIRKKGINPDRLDHARMAAEFTNHLIPGAVLTPGVVGTLPELQLAGFQYIK